MTTQDTVNEFFELVKEFIEHTDSPAEEPETPEEYGVIAELYKCHCLNQLNGTLLMLSKQLREKETRK